MKRIPSLDGLRAISIMVVVLGHLAKSRPERPADFLGSLREYWCTHLFRDFWISDYDHPAERAEQDLDY